MADTKKYKINRVSGVNSDGSAILEIVHPETEAGQVLYTDTIGGVAVDNVDKALVELKKLAQNSGVTSVNGKTGAVTLTPVDIGAVPVNDTAINAGTATKVTYNSYGVITGGAQATLDDILDGTTRKIPTDYIPTSQKGANGGVATLGDDGKVPTSQLPSYVDDVVEYANLSGFPTTGEAGKIYVDKQTNKTYRWSGTGYTEISASLAPGEVEGTAYPGDKGAENRTRIIAVEGDITKIKNGTTAVGKATDADKLGGVDADRYALIDNIPEDKLFIVTGTATRHGQTPTLDIATEEIFTAVEAGKIPILKITLTSIAGIQYIPLAHRNLFNSADELWFASVSDEQEWFISITRTAISESTLTYYLNSISDSDKATKPIISGFSNVYGALSVTRRAMTNDDLPTVSGLTAGSYSLVSVNTKGIVTGGNQLVQWGTPTNNTPSDTLAVGGLFFELVE